MSAIDFGSGGGSGYATAQTSPTVDVKNSGASGSDRSFRGSATINSNVITIATADHDFRVGQGIMIAGAGADAINRREIVQVIFDDDAKQNGNITVNVGGISNVHPAVATFETIEFTVTGAATAAGFIDFTVDATTYRINVAAAETVDTIAARIRAKNIEGWLADSTATGGVVRFSARSVGQKRISLVEVNDTGVVITGVSAGSGVVTRTLGTQTRTQDLANAVAAQAKAGWIIGKYDSSSIVTFLASTNGAKKSELTNAIDVGTSGVRARVVVIQYGSPLIAKITEISPDGLSITIDANAQRTIADIAILHDDTAAIQAALDLGAGKHIHIPNGTYNFTASLLPQSDQLISGESRWGAVLRSYGYRHYGFLIENLRNIDIRDLKIAHTSAPLIVEETIDVNTTVDPESTGIKIRNTYFISVRNCDFDANDDSGISVGMIDLGPNAIPNPMVPRFQGTTFAYIEGNIITNTAEGCGIEMSGCEYTRIENNVIQRTPETGIRMVACKNCLTTGNTISGTANGIKYQGGGSTSITQYTQDCAIINNTIRNPVKTDSSAIRVYAAIQRCQIKDNILIGNYLGGYGVRFDSSDNISTADPQTNENNVVQGNHIYGGFDRGISVSYENRGLAIYDNVIVNIGTANPDGTVGTTTYGIFLTNTAGYFLRSVHVERNRVVIQKRQMYGIWVSTKILGSSIFIHNNSIELRVNDTSINTRFLGDLTVVFDGVERWRTITIPAYTVSITIPANDMATGSPATDKTYTHTIPAQNIQQQTNTMIQLPIR